ncbi:MAG: imidazolonepropionase [Planctomycetota bacterium]|jgi:imidazolonepropionase-like amidohydrolase|nr:MAG: imidazolonepropionase [Planctomycetota bacterium]
MRLILLLSLLVACSTVVASDQIPGAPQKKPIALVNAVVHTLTGPPVEKCTIIFDEGKITDVGQGLAMPAKAEIIDLKGQHVYPSMIEAHSQIGLTEIAAVRATIDFAETGSINPNVSAHVAVNPDSELIPVTRANGVLIAVSAPAGGLVSGKASVMQLDGWTCEDMTVKPDIALVIHWPQMVPQPRPKDAKAEEGKTEKKNQAMKDLRDLFDHARAYSKARPANPAAQFFDSRLEAMLPVVEGKIPLLVAADRADQIQSAVAFGVEQNVRVIIFGGYDAEACAELLRRYSVPVIIDAIHKDPRREHEDYDAAFTLPERLRQAGVKFCISGSGRSETWNTRNLPYQAATAAAYGLPYEDAMRSVTIWPAEILGIADRVGTLEKGKDATLFVSDGDPLETETQVTAAWIQGRKVDLTSRHTQLFEKYSEKYRQLKDGR